MFAEHAGQNTKPVGEASCLPRHVRRARTLYRVILSAGRRPESKPEGRPTELVGSTRAWHCLSFLRRYAKQGIVRRPARSARLRLAPYGFAFGFRLRFAPLKMTDSVGSAVRTSQNSAVCTVDFPRAGRPRPYGFGVLSTVLCVHKMGGKTPTLRVRTQQTNPLSKNRAPNASKAFGARYCGKVTP